MYYPPKKHGTNRALIQAGRFYSVFDKFGSDLVVLRLLYFVFEKANGLHSCRCEIRGGGCSRMELKRY